MDVNVFAIDEAEHIDARRGVDGRADAAVDGLAAEDTACEVDHLQGGFTGIVDDPVAVAIEGEGP